MRVCGLFCRRCCDDWLTKERSPTRCKRMGQKQELLTEGYDMAQQTIHQRNATGMLLALGATGKHVYEGTVARATVLKRRAKNKAARKARRAGR